MNLIMSATSSSSSSSPASNKLQHQPTLPTAIVEPSVNKKSINTAQLADSFGKLTCSPTASTSMGGSSVTSTTPSSSNTSSSSSAHSSASSDEAATTTKFVDSHPETDAYLQFSSYINRGLCERQIRDIFYQHYALGNEIGKGGFGTIFSGIRRSDGKPVAIKVIKKSKITQWYECGAVTETAVDSTTEVSDGPIVTRRIPLEIALMIKVSSCEYCIRILDYLEQKSCFIIVMERLERSKDLFDLITEFGDPVHTATSAIPSSMSQLGMYGLEEKLARDYFKQIVEAALAILQLGVLHRDIKDENILVDLSTNQVKLIDFGAGTFVNETTNFNDFHG
jgi:hypothetical protein